MTLITVGLIGGAAGAATALLVIAIIEHRRHRPDLETLIRRQAANNALAAIHHRERSRP